MDTDGNELLAATVAHEYELIDVDPDSGEKINNVLDKTDLNYYYDDMVTYLSRSDWQNTWPKEYEGLEASDEMIADIQNDYTPAETDVTEITYGEDNGLVLSSLREASFDDSRWDDL